MQKIFCDDGSTFVKLAYADEQKKLLKVLSLISKSDSPTKKEDISEGKKVLDEIKNNLLLG